MPASASLTVGQCGPVGVTVVDPKMFENVWNKRVIDNKPYRVDICGTMGVTVVDPNNSIIDNKPYARAHGKRTAGTGTATKLSAVAVLWQVCVVRARAERFFVVREMMT